MRISDWSSDVCSSDLVIPQAAFIRPGWAGKAPALIGGTVGGATETARELSGDGQIDPLKVGMAASAGALMQRPTRLGRAVGVPGSLPSRKDSAPPTGYEIGRASCRESVGQ